MSQPDNQSIIIESGSEAAHAGLLDDLTVQNANAIKGGGAGNDVYQWDPGDGIDLVHRRDSAVRA